MSINLKHFQERAVDELVTKVAGLLDREGDGEVCVFRSPTGSGKTVMTARFIQELIRELPDERISFLWISIGKGNLHIQSKNSLEKIFNGAPRVSLVEMEFCGGREQMAKNEVVVANWEKLRTKDKKTGKWKAIIMKDGEKINFREVLERTRERNRLILIIDESHIGATAERTNELRDIIKADVVIEMSATPTITKDAFEIVYVKPQDVISEGMIKKEIIINSDIEKLSSKETDSQEVVLEASFQKRKQLKKKFEKEESNINPLVLIQLPTAEAGASKMEAVRLFLSKKGITEKNRKLAIWLSEQKSKEIDYICDEDSPVEFLIFKQAIDTGWDCPRAHILVKFRETRSETFEIQTVGRIMRMPERKHYADEDLNRAYIFTNMQSILVKKEEYNPNIIKDLRAKLVDNYKKIKLVSYYKTRADFGDITSSFMSVFIKTANKYFDIDPKAIFSQNGKKLKAKGVNPDPKFYQQKIISDTKVDIKDFDSLEGKIDPKAFASLTIAGNDLMDLFEHIIKQNLGSFRNIKRSVPSVKSAIYQWFRDVFGSESWNEEILIVQQIFVHNGNRKVFEEILSKAIEIYRGVKEKEVRKRMEESEVWYDYELPKQLFYNEYVDEKVDHKKYAFNPCYLGIDRSKPEKSFEKFLDNNETIKWWWKNGENKQDYFGVKYEYAGEIATFYPDYIARFNNGKVGIFEVKDEGDRDGSTKTKAKAEALQKHITDSKRKDLIGGIAIENSGAWLLNSEKVYNWEKSEKGDWGDWGEWEEIKL